LALLVPILAFTGFLLFQFATSERAHLEDDALATARRISVVVDRELANMVAALDVLALSPSLAAGDMAAFHAQASRMYEQKGAAVVLRDLSGMQVVNVRVPFGRPLLRFNVEGEEAAMRQGRFFVSNIYKGPNSGLLLVSVTIPVTQDGERKYMLSLSVPLERIRDIILRESPQSTAVVGVIDRNGRIVARSVRHEDFANKFAADDTLSNSNANEGTWNGTAVDGLRIFGAYSRSTFSDWRVAIGVPEAALDAPLRRSLMLFAMLGLGLTALSVLAASFYARRIVRPMRLLAAGAAELGRGEPVEPVRTRIPEVQRIADAMAAASDALRQRERELRDFSGALEREVGARTADLMDANAKLRAEAEERERVEQQLRQAQKMEAVGQLTGGIAHDFNNLLAVITGNLDLLSRRLQMGRTNVERFADNALEASQRAATLTHRLLAFSRQQPLSPEPVDANRLVGGMSDLLMRAIGDGIELETVLAGGLWRTHADPNQLENALLNLAVNARDAMGGRGKITIETCNAHIDELYSSDHNIPTGQYVLLAVTDTGEGMTPGVIARAFEPFFTTKGPGQGTGLGLSQVYGFVRQSRGHVKIYSELGHGTTVKLYFPRFMGALNEVEEQEQTALPTGTELILLVEDEANVRRINSETLRELGYRVLEAENAREALKLLDGDPSISLLFTDVMMPEMNGPLLAQEVLRRRPGLPVLYTSGYTRNAVVHNGVLDAGVNLLPKPFTMDQLARKLREVLDAPVFTEEASSPT
jgi:signal transduction histidine kinase/ActR/RegA family two-component response regulator